MDAAPAAGGFAPASGRVFAACSPVPEAHGASGRNRGEPLEQRAYTAHDNDTMTRSHSRLIFCRLIHSATSTVGVMAHPPFGPIIMVSAGAPIGGGAWLVRGISPRQMPFAAESCLLSIY
ncbi:MAG TPA: hypothetical protein VMU87_22775 [Stellaceae bacterium]|nr:hypothetical protein [Stellaceae bacterium]